MKHLILFSCLLLLGSCGKKDPATPTAVFEGYTGRDAKGVLTGPTDPTDWTLDNTTWNSAEMGLFAKYKLSFSQSPVATSTWQPSLRPNPAAVGGSSTFIISVDKTSTVVPPAPRMAYAVVDTNYTILSWGDINEVNKNFGSVIDHTASQFKGSTLYRLYYVIYDQATSAVIYKGHGDIQL